MSSVEPTPSRGHPVLARTLVVLGLVLAFLSLLSGYLRWQVFDEGTFEETAAELVQSEPIRQQVAARLVTQLYANVDVRAELEQQLPEDQKGLAGPLAGALRQLGDRAAYELLGRPRIQELFVRSAVLSQRVARRALDDDLGPVQTTDGKIVLDLHGVVVELANELSFLGGVAERLPAGVGVIEIADAKEFETAQEAARLFRAVAVVLPFLALALLIAGVFLARRRRRELAIAAFGLGLAGVLMLVVRAVAGRVVVDRLSAASADDEAVREAWRILTSLLADGAWSFVILAVGALTVVWLLAADGLGARARSALAPLLARRSTGYAIAAAILLVLVWWQPTAQLGRLSFVLVGASLLVVAVEVLRRTVRCEDPAAATEPPLSRLQLSLPRRAAAQPAPAAPVGVGGALLADELERLARLHESGALDDADYARAKARLLG